MSSRRAAATTTVWPAWAALCPREPSRSPRVLLQTCLQVSHCKTRAMLLVGDITFPHWDGDPQFEPYTTYKQLDDALNRGQSLDAAERTADWEQLLIDRGAVSSRAPARSSSRATATGSSRTTPSSGAWLCRNQPVRLWSPEFDHTGIWATARRPASRASRLAAAPRPTRSARPRPPTLKSSSAAGTTRRRPCPPPHRWIARAARSD